MRGIDFLISVQFRFGFFKINSDSVLNEFDSVRLKNAVRFRYYSYLLLM